MKTIGKSTLTVILLLVVFMTTAHAGQYPKSTGYVNDFAEVLTYDQWVSLNQELAAFEKKTAVDITVITVPSLRTQSIEKYTKGIFKEWGTGKSENNRIIFLVAPKEGHMRIETSFFARTVLEDSLMKQIRDNEISSRFKGGNMAQGIIDGTHRIMQTFDPSFIPTKRTERLSAPQPASKEWTFDYVKILVYTYGGIIFAIFFLFLIVPSIRATKAQKWVQKSMGVFALKFVEADEDVKNPDVEEETRQKFTALKIEFSSMCHAVEQLSKRGGDVNWFELRERFDSMGYSIGRVMCSMRKEIIFAEKARKECPELLEKTPGLIEAVRNRLAIGKRSSKAMKYFKKACAQFAQIQHHQTEMGMTNLIALYEILLSIQANMANAEVAHQSANTARSSGLNEPC